MADDGADEWDDAEPESPAASVVRPYTFTAGRTTSTVEVPLEATIEITRAALDHQWPLHNPSGQIIDLCTSERLSVAEIAARSGLAIGVARVLVGDLASDGYVQLQKTLTESATVDERISLIERTLRGLRDL